MVSGIIVMRQGENVRRVIDRVKAKIKEIEPGLPPGVKLVTAYDRFLWHVPSAAIPIVTIPIAVMILIVFFGAAALLAAAPIAPR